MLTVVLIIAGIILLIALTKNSKSKRKQSESKEKDDSLKRKIELEIIIKEAESKGLDVSEYKEELTKLKSDRDKSSDPAYKYIDK